MKAVMNVYVQFHINFTQKIFPKHKHSGCNSEMAHHFCELNMGLHNHKSSPKQMGLQIQTPYKNFEFWLIKRFWERGAIFAELTCMLFISFVVMFGYKGNNHLFNSMERFRTIVTFMILDIQMKLSHMFVELTFCVCRKITLLAHDISNLIMDSFHVSSQLTSEFWFPITFEAFKFRKCLCFGNPAISLGK